MVRSELRVECRKEGQAVLDDRTADVAAGIEFRISVRSNARERKIFCRPDKTLRQTVCKNIAVIVVAARFGDDVENAAGRKALISSKGAGLDLDFLNKLERQIYAPPPPNAGSVVLMPSRM